VTGDALRWRKRDLRDRIFEGGGSAPAPVEAPVTATPEPPVEEADAAISEPAVEGAPAAARTPYFRSEGVRLRLLPIVMAAGAALSLPLLAQTFVYFVQTFVRLPGSLDSEWGAEAYEYAMLFLVSLGSIWVAKSVLKADYGLHLPRGRSFAGSAIVWGVALGVAMALVTWAPNIVAQQPLRGQFDLSQQNVVGWLVARGLLQGPGEETAFRGLIVTYLLATVPGRVWFGRIELGVGGVIAAVIVALGHLPVYFALPLYVALAQQVLIFVSGVLFAFWFERSKSLLAPILGHDISGAVEMALVFVMVSWWGALSA
jgi:membrane protease YdiL (CAAX protease family)